MRFSITWIFFAWILLLLKPSEIDGIISFQRWCNLTEPPRWEQYNDSLLSCAQCGSTYNLFAQSSVVQCCSGFFSASCQTCTEGTTHVCKNGNKYCDKDVCNGVNECGDATDELNTLNQNCSKSLCEIGQFRCGLPSLGQCYLPTKTCDHLKECADGLDETNCPYYGGICPGFLCIVLPQCINKSSVCNGVKDCIDGSDEWSCYPRHEESVYFYCDGATETSKTINTNRVCDGINHCNNGLDEDNCYTWTPWSSWSSCVCDVSSSGTRTRKCVTFNSVEKHVEGKCIGLSNDGYCKECPGVPPLSTTLIIVVSLVSIIVIVGVGCIVYLCWNSSVKRAHTTTQLENSQSPAFYSPTQHQSSADAEKSFRAGSTLSTNNNLLDKSPAFSRHSQCSHLTTDTAVQPRPSPSVAPPLPARPISFGEAGYSSIKELSSIEIDPYAQTKHVKVGSPRLKANHLKRFDSSECFPNMESHMWSSEQRLRTVSRFPLDELGHAPSAPMFKRSRSMEALDRDGYLVPTPSQKLRMDKKGNYTAMSSPEKGAPFRTTPISGKGYTKVVKRQNRNPILTRQKNSLRKATSFSYNKNTHPKSGRNSPSHSETYTNILRTKNEYQNSLDAKERLMNYINELAPPSGELPVRSPPPFNPPKLEISASSPQRSPQNIKTLPNKHGLNLQGSQYDSLFAANNTQNDSGPGEDYGKLEKEEIDLT